VVKVFVSVFGDERGREVAIAGLKSKAKYVRSELGKRMKLRLTPEIRFIEDDSFEKGSRVCVLTCVFVSVGTIARSFSFLTSVKVVYWSVTNPKPRPYGCHLKPYLIVFFATLLYMVYTAI